MLCEICIYAFIVLLLSGTWLAIFYDPSMSETTYNGTYEGLRGVTMWRAYESTVNISMDVCAAVCSSARCTTGRAAVRRRDDRAHDADVLHRSVPPAA